MAAKKPHISGRDPEKLFEIICQIGSGSYGAVHKARILKTGKLAAIKMINMEDGEEFSDVENEIAMLEECNHENIVAYYGAFIKNTTMWICMEFCAGGSVSDMYNSLGKPLLENEIAHIMYYSLAGLDYLHSTHKIHRDIKGGNILLTDAGEVKLADLGVSAQLDATLAKRKSFIGTPYWIAPEIIAVEMKMGPDGYSSKCDVWSLGITGIELAEMAPPMFDLHPMRALYLIPKNPPPKLNDKAKWGKDFREWVKICLTKNPLKRPAAGPLMKHPFFKIVKTTPGTLSELVLRVKDKGDRKRISSVQTYEEESDEEGDVATLTREKQAQMKRVPSVRKPILASASAARDGADMKVDNVEPDVPPPPSGPASESIYEWGHKIDHYVPIAAAGKAPVDKVYNAVDHDCRFCGTPMTAMNHKEAEAHLQTCAKSRGAAISSADSGAHSFVLSNVFAGCPLKVLCAASWKCTPPGGLPCLYIIVGAEMGLYILETSGDKRELVQVSKRVCTWLHVMDDEGMMISVSGEGLVCVHDLNSLIVGPDQEIKFKTTKLIEGAKGGRCAVTRTPDTGFTFLCAAVTRNLVLMQWYAPRKKFMKLKDFETPFELPPAMMELLVLPEEPLPVLCVGSTRDRKTRDKALAIVNPNHTNEKVEKHMSAELGWVRVRAGREDVFATSVKQVGVNRFMLCFSNVASFVDADGNAAPLKGQPEKIVFETAPETVVYTPDAVIAFSPHRMERRSIYTGKITHQMKDKDETFRVVGKEGNIIIETRAAGEATSHLYLLVRK